MYVVPTQPLESLKMPINLNQVNIAGSVGYIGEQRREDAFNFGVMCSKLHHRKALVILGKIALAFKIESWGDDAERMKKISFCRKSYYLSVEHLSLKVGLIGMVIKEIITK